LVVLAASAFFVLTAPPSMGTELAVELPISLAGMLVAAYAAASRMAGILLVLVPIFGILLIGSVLANVPAFSTAESGNAGFLAFGFGMYWGANPSLSRAALATAEGPGARPRLEVIAVGVGAALFKLAFAAFVLLEYFAASPIRYVAR